MFLLGVDMKIKLKLEARPDPRDCSGRWCVCNEFGIVVASPLEESTAREFAAAHEMAEMLRLIEWSQCPCKDSHLYCDFCGESKKDGHSKGCDLAALLSRIEAPK